ncbi:tyrosine-type recombinase/integrase [Turicimonas muris]|uniref:tyrosine-type recombinase/integrase n=1 Tax=Turicimonas muris TaxID=1796652 RepID=UPI0023F03F96|nr:integrase arm-type DNA-binding domain-containing protein [Turicimonas muris]
MNLTKNFIASAKDGIYSDNNSAGLYLRVRREGKSRTWFFKRQLSGKKKEVSLGSALVVSLPKARSRADHLRSLSEEEFFAEVERKEAPREEVCRRTFEDVAKEYVDWTVTSGTLEELSKTHKSLQGRLANHIYPFIGKIPFDEVRPEEVANMVMAVWDRPYTAKKIRAIVKQIFNWGIAKGYSSGSNPSSLDGPLQFLLPKAKPKVNNRGALDPLDVPEFMATLWQHLTGPSFRCGFFAILTAVRSQTARMARWEQIDFEKQEWIIPPSQLKIADNGTLIVPLAPEVVNFLKSLTPQKEGLIFPNNKGKVMSDTVFSRVPLELEGKWVDKAQSLNKGEEIKATMHGIARASFRTWSQDDRLGNDKRFDPRIAEICLHHKCDDGYKGAYERNKFFLRRREMMNAWAQFCFSKI